MISLGEVKQLNGSDVFIISVFFELQQAQICDSHAHGFTHVPGVWHGTMAVKKTFIMLVIFSTSYISLTGWNHIAMELCKTIWCSTYIASLVWHGWQFPSRPHDRQSQGPSKKRSWDWKSKQTNKQTNKQPRKQANKQTNKQASKQTNKHKQTSTLINIHKHSFCHKHS